MGNEKFLICSYFVSGFICAALGFGAYLWLRRPAGQVFKTLERKHWQGILGKSFPFTTALFTLSAFLSVSYFGCSGRQYQNIVSDRAYILRINERQLSESLSAIVLAVLLWALVIAFNLVSIRRRQAQSNLRDEDDRSSARR